MCKHVVEYCVYYFLSYNRETLSQYIRCSHYCCRDLSGLLVQIPSVWFCKIYLFRIVISITWKINFRDDEVSFLCQVECSALECAIWEPETTKWWCQLCKFLFIHIQQVLKTVIFWQTWRSLNKQIETGESLLTSQMIKQHWTLGVILFDIISTCWQN